MALTSLTITYRLLKKTAKPEGSFFSKAGMFNHSYNLSTIIPEKSVISGTEFVAAVIFIKEN